jgi:hypothetical protein
LKRKHLYKSWDPDPIIIVYDNTNTARGRIHHKVASLQGRGIDESEEYPTVYCTLSKNLYRMASYTVPGFGDQSQPELVPLFHFSPISVYSRKFQYLGNISNFSACQGIMYVVIIEI